MGVETSNQQQYGTDNALNELIALVPTMTKSQRSAWRMKGSDAILAEVARLKTEKVVVATPPAIDPVAEKKAAEEADEKAKPSRGKKSD